jgi:hypothetical protein
MRKLTNPHDFIGKFFFSFKNDELQWQGQIISKVSESVFLVRLHEWTTGGSSDQFLVSVPDMMRWRFFDTADDWRSALGEYESQKASVARSIPPSTSSRQKAWTQPLICSYL